jgi:dihydrofolate synthase/folylpolyglutamate synthase
MFESYFEIREWLEFFIPEVYSRKELGLRRIENLLKKIRNPEKKFKSIHVGGTSGKGSTAFYVSRLLQYSGYKVGLHVSPHLLYIGERMQINGKSIPVKRLVALVNEIKPVVDEIKSKQPHLTPSYFEILVALSFLYFAKEKVDIAVVEVGLGGRLDATNVLQPEVSVITNIGLDHTDILGNTLEQIAREKAGIIKIRVPVVTGASGSALKVIEEVAKSKDSLLIKLNTRSFKFTPNIDMVIDTSIYIDIYRYSRNKAVLECMFMAVLAVLEAKMKISEGVLKRAFSVGFGGRFEEIEKNIILDGAHNVQKIKALINYLRMSKVKGQKFKMVLVVAFKKGKDWKKIVDLLIKNLPIRKVFATEFLSTTDMGRYASVDAEEISRYLVKDKELKTKIRAMKNSQKALFSALNDKKENDLVLVTGSLYLVGEAQTLWKLPTY